MPTPNTELTQTIAAVETKFEREFADVHEVLKSLGEENQARANEITMLQTDTPSVDDWQNRSRIGFKKNVEAPPAKEWVPPANLSKAKQPRRLQN